MPTFNYPAHLKYHYKNIDQIIERDSSEELAKFIQENKIDINENICNDTYKYNLTLLCAAVHHGSISIVKYLLEKGCKLEQDVQANELSWALAHCIVDGNRLNRRARHEAIAAMLICYGANAKHPSVITEFNKKPKDHKFDKTLTAHIDEIPTTLLIPGAIEDAAGFLLDKAGYAEESLTFYERGMNAGHALSPWNLAYQQMAHGIKPLAALKTIEENQDTWKSSEINTQLVLNFLHGVIKVKKDIEVKKTAIKTLSLFYTKIGKPVLAKECDLIITQYDDLLKVSHDKLSEHLDEEVSDPLFEKLQPSFPMALEFIKKIKLARHVDEALANVKLRAFTLDRFSCTMGEKLYACHEFVNLATTEKEQKSLFAKKLAENDSLWRGICHLYELNGSPRNFMAAMQLFEIYAQEKEQSNRSAATEARAYKTIAIAYCLLAAQQSQDKDKQAHFLSLLFKNAISIDNIPMKRDLIRPFLHIIANINEDMSLCTDLIEMILQLTKLTSSDLECSFQTDVFNGLKLLPQTTQHLPIWKAIISRLNDNHSIAFSDDDSDFESLIIDQLISLQTYAEKLSLHFQYYLFQALADCYSRYKKNKPDLLKLAIEYFQKQEKLAKELGLTFEPKKYIEALNCFTLLAKENIELHPAVLSAYKKSQELGDDNAFVHVAELDEKQIPAAINFYAELMHKGLDQKQAPQIMTALQNLVTLMQQFAVALPQAQHQMIENAILSAYLRNPLFATMMGDLCDIGMEKILKPSLGFSPAFRAQIQTLMQPSFISSPKHHDKITAHFEDRLSRLKQTVVERALTYSHITKIGEFFSHTSFKKDLNIATKAYLDYVMEESKRTMVVTYFKMALMYYVSNYKKYKDELEVMLFPEIPEDIPVLVNFYCEIRPFYLELMLANVTGETDQLVFSKKINAIYSSICKDKMLTKDVHNSLVERIIIISNIFLTTATLPVARNKVKDLLYNIVFEPSEFLVDKALVVLTPTFQKGGPINLLQEEVFQIAAQKDNFWATFRLAEYIKSPLSHHMDIKRLFYLTAKAKILAAKDSTFPQDKIEQSLLVIMREIAKGTGVYRQYFQLANWYLEIIASAANSKVHDVDIFLHEAVALDHPIYNMVKLREYVTAGAKLAYGVSDSYDEWIQDKYMCAATTRVAEEKVITPPALNPAFEADSTFYPVILSDDVAVPIVEKDPPSESLYPSLSVSGLFSSFKKAKQSSDYMPLSQTASVLPSAPTLLAVVDDHEILPVDEPVLINDSEQQSLLDVELEARLTKLNADCVVNDEKEQKSPLLEHHLLRDLDVTGKKKKSKKAKKEQPEEEQRLLVLG